MTIARRPSFSSFKLAEEVVIIWTPVLTARQLDFERWPGAA